MFPNPETNMAVQFPGNLEKQFRKSNLIANSQTNGRDSTLMEFNRLQEQLFIFIAREVAREADKRFLCKIGQPDVIAST